MFRTDDPAMAAAIAKARGSLGAFWQMFEKPQPGVDGFALKVAIPYGPNAHEHFWLTNIDRESDRLVGTIDNEPQDARQVRRGQRYPFTEANVSDWMFRRNGKIVGAETLRVMLPRLPPDQAQRFRAMLETP